MAKTKSDKIRYIVFSCGYVESSYTSIMVYQCAFFGHPGYDTYQEALTNLALDMYAKFYDENMSIYENRYGRDVKNCCREKLIANPEANFCSDCGTRIQDKTFDPEEFRNFIKDLHGSTCDSYGEAEGTTKRTFTWWPYWTGDFMGAPKSEILYLAENAEHVILCALYDAMPELKKLIEHDPYEGYENDVWNKLKEGKHPEYR